MIVSQTLLNQRNECAAFDAAGEGKTLRVEVPVTLQLDRSFSVACAMINYGGGGRVSPIPIPDSCRYLQQSPVSQITREHARPRQDVATDLHMR